MPTDIQWKGYAIEDTQKWDEFKLIDFEPKPPGDYDVDIRIEFCGVCGSDVHTITGGWGDVHLPCITGHEIAGHVARVGSKVTGMKVGDRVGVGAQVCSCLNCDLCRSDNEPYCQQPVWTYNSVYPESGTHTTGGYSTAIRVHEHFVFRIPDNMKLEETASLFCAGATVFSPLVRNGAGPGKNVGVVGIGGLGHLAIQFAKALGCQEVVAFSHSTRKKDDATKLGATQFVATGESDFAKPLKAKLDLIVCTADVVSGVPVSELLSTLRPGGRFILVAVPEGQFTFPGSDLIQRGILVGGSAIASRKEILQMLKVASEKGVRPWIEVMPMKDAGKAVRSLKEGHVRYRHVLIQDIQ